MCERKGGGICWIEGIEENQHERKDKEEGKAGQTQSESWEPCTRLPSPFGLKANHQTREDKKM